MYLFTVDKLMSKLNTLLAIVQLSSRHSTSFQKSQKHPRPSDVLVIMYTHVYTCNTVHVQQLHLLPHTLSTGLQTRNAHWPFLTQTALTCIISMPHNWKQKHATTIICDNHAYRCVLVEATNQFTRLHRECCITYITYVCTCTCTCIQCMHTDDTRLCNSENLRTCTCTCIIAPCCEIPVLVSLE